MPAVLLSVPGSIRRDAIREVVDDLSRLALRPESRTSVCSVDGVGFSASMRYLKYLSRKLAKSDILHLVFFPGACSVSLLLLSVLLARFLGRKVILDYRSPVLPAGLIERSLFKKLWRISDRVLVPSSFQQQLVNSMGGSGECVRPEVDLDAIEPRVIKNVQPRVIVSADLEREHNVICLIRACALVKKKYPRTELVIIGSGSQKTGLERLVSGAKLSGVTFAGSLSRRGRWDCFRSSDVYVNCSTIDFLSEATMEAFAFGLPVLTTPLSGGSEPLRNRDNVILLAYNDHVGLAQRLIELVEDPQLCEKLSIGSRQIATRHEPASSADRWQRIYGRLVKSD